MKTNQQLIPITAILLMSLSSCMVPSFYPLYEDADIVDADQFEGVWITNGTVLELSRDRNIYDSYILRYKECEDPVRYPDQYASCSMAEFRVRFILLDNEYFADFVPMDYTNTENRLMKSHVMALHSFTKVSVDDRGDLSLKFINPDWLKKHLARNPQDLEFIQDGNDFYLTAQSKELQEFILKNQGAKGFYYEPTKLRNRVLLLQELPTIINRN